MKNLDLIDALELAIQELTNLGYNGLAIDKLEEQLKALEASKAKALDDLYLDWLNNFLTVERFAEYYGFSEEFANSFLNEYRRKHSK